MVRKTRTSSEKTLSAPHPGIIAVIAVVLAIGLIFAISKCVATQDDGKAKQPSVLTITASGLQQTETASPDGAPASPSPAEQRISPAIYELQCQGSPGGQDYKRKGSLGPTQSRKVKVGYEPKTKRMSCTVTVTAPDGFQATDGDQRKVKLKPGQPETVTIPFRRQ